MQVKGTLLQQQLLGSHISDPRVEATQSCLNSSKSFYKWSQQASLLLSPAQAPEEQLSTA